MAGRGQLAGQHDVAVEDRPGGVADGVVHVVALDEHGVEAGDRAALAAAGPLEQAGEQGEDRRRVAPGGRRLAGGEADLALGHGEAGEAVHHQQRRPCPGRGTHSAMRVAVNGGPEADEGGLVGGGDDDDRAGEALGAEVALEELADLTAALADEGEHGDLGVGAAGDHRQQARLADAGAGEDAHALAAAAGDQGVEGPHAERAGARRRCGGGSGCGRRAVDAPTRRRASRSSGRPSSGSPKPSRTRPSRRIADEHRRAAAGRPHRGADGDAVEVAVGQARRRRRRGGR